MSIFTQGWVSDAPRKVLKGEVPLFLKLLFEVFHKVVLSMRERHHEATYRDMGLANALDIMTLLVILSLSLKINGFPFHKLFCTYFELSVVFELKS